MDPDVRIRLPHQQNPRIDQSQYRDQVRSATFQLMEHILQRFAGREDPSRKLGENLVQLNLDHLLLMHCRSGVFLSRSRLQKYLAPRLIDW